MICWKCWWSGGFTVNADHESVAERTLACLPRRSYIGRRNPWSGASRCPQNCAVRRVITQKRERRFTKAWPTQDQHIRAVILITVWWPVTSGNTHQAKINYIPFNHRWFRWRLYWNSSVIRIGFGGCVPSKMLTNELQKKSLRSIKSKDDTKLSVYNIRMLRLVWCWKMAAF